MTDENGQLTDQKFGWIPSQSLRCHLREHESRGRESPRKTSMSSEPRSDAKAAMPSKTTKERRLTQIAADCESKNASGTLHMERKDWIEGRNEVINEALADEVRRGEQRKNRSDGTTV